MRLDPCIVTTSGGKVSLLHPQASQINLIDIAHHLALKNRFGGATRQPYSVAQHSCVVSSALLAAGHGPRVAFYGQLHDAKEFVIGDVMSPMKVALFGTTGLKTDLDEIEEGVDNAIYGRLGIRAPTPREADLVHAADTLALATEWRDLMPKAQVCPVDVDPLPFQIVCWPWQLAEKRFFDNCIRLAIDAGIDIPAVEELT